MSEIKDPKSWDTPFDDPCVWTLGASNSQLKSLKNHQSFQWSNQKYSQKNRPKCSIASICLTLLDDKSTGSQNSQLKNISDLTTNWGIGGSLKSNNNLELKTLLDPSDKLQVFYANHFNVVKRSIPILLLHWWTSHQVEPESQANTTIFRHFLSLFKVLQNLRCKLPMLARTGSTTHPQSKSDCNSWKLPDAHFYHHLLHCVCFQRFPKSKSIKDRLWQKASLDCWIKIVHYAMTTGLRFLHCTQHQPWSSEALSSIHGIKFTSVTTPASHWPRPVHCLPPHWAYLRVFRLLPRDLKKSQLQKASNTSKFPTMPAPSDEDTRPLSKTLSYVVPNLSGGISGGTEGVSEGWAVSHWHSAVWSLSCKFTAVNCKLSKTKQKKKCSSTLKKKGKYLSFQTSWNL